MTTAKASEKSKAGMTGRWFQCWVGVTEREAGTTSRTGAVLLFWDALD